MLGMRCVGVAHAKKGDSWQREVRFLMGLDLLEWATGETECTLTHTD